MRVVFRLEALRDLNSQLSYIAKDDPAAATRVGEAIMAAIERLNYFPYSGREGSVAGTYELVVPRLPYIAV